MPQKAVERRFAAIMMTDIVGSSRLMGLDDVATLEAMDDLRGSVIDPAVARNYGRIVKTIGDAVRQLPYEVSLDGIGRLRSSDPWSPS